MKFSLLIPLSIILISCQKDISNYLIQPPKQKGQNVSEVFPYVKYTSVKSYSFDKFYTIVKDSANQALIDSLVNVGIEEKLIDSLRGSELPKIHIIVNEGKVSEKAIFEQKLNRKEIQMFANCFDREMLYTYITLENGEKRLRKPKPHPNSECMPNYRDALVFFNGEQPVAWVNICFKCSQIEFAPKVTQKIYFYKRTWEKLEIFFDALGHDVDYHDNWR